MRKLARADRALLILIALSLAAAYAVYWVLRHPQSINLGLESDWLALTLLGVTLTLLLVGLLFVLLRNLIKLLMERRRHVLGSRFQTKLVFIFLVLVLIPSIALFATAVRLILQVNETLFTAPRKEVVEESKRIVDLYNGLQRADCGRFAAEIAGEIAAGRLLEPGRRPELTARAASWRAKYGLDAVAIFAAGAGGDDGAGPTPDLLVADAGDAPESDPEMMRWTGRAAAPRKTPFWKLGERAADRAGAASPGEETDAAGAGIPDKNIDAAPSRPGARETGEGGAVAGEGNATGGAGDVQAPPQAAPAPTPGRPKLEWLVRSALTPAEGETPSAQRLDRLGSWLRVSAVEPIDAEPGHERPSGVIVTVRYIRPEQAERADRIDRAFREYRSSLNQLPGIRRIYIQLLAILTLLVLFAGTWAGFYLARQITVPIQALVEGTQQISAGNLDHRVTIRAGDEIGYLIDSFNSMTAELRASREAVTLSRRDLEASNRQLEERRRYIEQLLENVPAAVISLDANGGVTTMNRAAFRLLGVQPGAVAPGRPAEEVFGKPDLAPLLREIDTLRRGEGQPLVHEFDISVEGRPLHLAASVSPRLDAEGRSMGALIVLDDLTPLIRAQRTTAWSEVARRIAHEIKNPLTPIQLSAQRIQKKLHERSDDLEQVIDESAAAIVKEVGTLKSLVDEFSRFARMPAVRPVPTDPNSVVEAAVALFEGIHPDVVLKKELQRDLPAAPIDPDQMKRVLINLIDNSVSAMDGKGTIVVRTREAPDERIVRIEVEDDGPGIPPENKERLFVPYFSTKKRGTGLGLAIANRIVSDHNGFIRIEDASPRGARFVIELPA